jgi:hypothetical protein
MMGIVLAFCHILMPEIELGIQWRIHRIVETINYVDEKLYIYFNVTKQYLTESSRSCSRNC